MKHNDIRLIADKEKEDYYERVHLLYKEGQPVKVREHQSGFPAVTIDCADIHLLTDCLSLEAWWKKKKEEVELKVES